jgi:hypothetical protein
MLYTKFCSQCGEKIKGNRPSLFGLAAVCTSCKKQTRFARFALVALFISFATGVFFVGRATTPRQSFQFIGKPIEIQSADNSATAGTNTSPANNVAANTEKQTASSETAYPETTASPKEALTVCGAPTKSGRPCRRKVRGSGYCWQHKDKFKAQAKASR